MIEDIWKPIKNYECLYEVSNLGRVRSLDKYVNYRYGNMEVKGKILDEPNKIEKCKGYENFLSIDDYIEHLKSQIDLLIDKVNSLDKENKYGTRKGIDY